MARYRTVKRIPGQRRVSLCIEHAPSTTPFMNTTTEPTTPSPIKCLHCDKPVYGRGLCAKAYHIARQLIKDGKLTWEDLERRGKALPPKQYTAKESVVKWLLE
jgi:hypothetical protein